MLSRMSTSIAAWPMSTVGKKRPAPTTLPTTFAATFLAGSTGTSSVSAARTRRTPSPGVAAAGELRGGTRCAGARSGSSVPRHWPGCPRPPYPTKRRQARTERRGSREGRQGGSTTHTARDSPERIEARSRCRGTRLGGFDAAQPATSRNVIAATNLFIAHSSVNRSSGQHLPRARATEWRRCRGRHRGTRGDQSARPALSPHACEAP